MLEEDSLSQAMISDHLRLCGGLMASEAESTAELKALRQCAQSSIFWLTAWLLL